jgi:hypothetical protein
MDMATGIDAFGINSSPSLLQASLTLPASTRFVHSDSLVASQTELVDGHDALKCVLVGILAWEHGGRR